MFAETLGLRKGNTRLCGLQLLWPWHLDFDELKTTLLFYLWYSIASYRSSMFQIR